MYPYDQNGGTSPETKPADSLVWSIPVSKNSEKQPEVCHDTQHTLTYWMKYS